MSRYHINPDTMRAGICRAQPGNCLFRDEDNSERTHYSSKQEAISAAENLLQQKVGTPKLVKKIVKQNTQVFGSNVSLVTNLCEEAVATGSDIKVIAKNISQINDSQRVVALRGLKEEEIEKILSEWKQSLRKLTAEKIGSDNFSIQSGNSGGNSADSDLVVIANDENVMNLETKFGAATNSAAGIQRVSSLINADAFTLDNSEKLELLNIYSKEGGKDEAAVIQKLDAKMRTYAEDFNSKNHTVNSQEIYDIVKSSGKKGNSQQVKDYSIVNFRQNDGKGYISETEISLSEDEQWNVTAVVNSGTDTARLSYEFTTTDGQKYLKVLFNNKNSTYAIKNPDGSLKIVNKKNYNTDELIRIPSKLQMGTGSYNVWYKEGLEKD